MKQTKHSRKSEAQNLCSKCPPFTRTHAFKQLRHCAIADGFGDSVQSWCYAAALLGTRVKVNGEYYRNTVLLNMLMLDIRSVFWNYYVFSKMVHQHIVHVIRALSPCCRERRQSLSLQRCGHLIRQIWIRWTTASVWGMLQEKVYRSWIHDVSWKNVESWKNVCWGSGGCWTMHTVIAAAIAQWHSRLNACGCVNGGHFENKFWASDFLLCFVSCSLGFSVLGLLVSSPIYL